MYMQTSRLSYILLYNVMYLPFHSIIIHQVPAVIVLTHAKTFAIPSKMLSFVLEGCGI